jgi:5'-phosphate synthase pdxT subunit
MKELTVGIVGIQGDLEEHIASVKHTLEDMDLAGDVKRIKYAKEIDSIDGLIIPGGESTVIGNILKYRQMLQQIKNRMQDGLPVFGTCAGLIILAKKSYDKVVGKKDQPKFGIMDITVERNSFGRQKESFETDLEFRILGDKKFKGVFIRAPSIIEVGSDVQILSKLNGLAVAVQEENMLGTTFHPEVVDDIRLHKYFINMIISKQQKKNSIDLT